MAGKREVRLPAVIGIALVSIILFAWGATLGLAYLRATDPVALESSALKATGIVTAQREALRELPNSQYPTSTVVSQLSFDFTDRDGLQRSGEDEVSATYYAAHPVGHEVDVFYQSGPNGWAVLGSPARLASKVSRLDLMIASLMLIAGAAGVAWAANRWLINRRGHGFL